MAVSIQSIPFCFNWSAVGQLLDNFVNSSVDVNVQQLELTVVILILIMIVLLAS